MDTTTNTTNRNKAGDRAKRLVTSGLHPRVWAAMIALSLWFVVWVWSFFSTGGGVVGYLLFVVSGFIGVVIALQLILSSVRRPTEIPNPIPKKMTSRHSTTGSAGTSIPNVAGWVGLRSGSDHYSSVVRSRSDRHDGVRN
ncbi:MAG: hypothetical protein WAK55_17565 [Xanthobacteraceae bacterium]